MVKFYTSNYTYDYPFPTVCLAYFLRYPNPYATHVISTDVIDRSYDHSTQRLQTTRLHLKRSKLPRAVVALLPRNLLGSMRGDTQDAGKETRSYILETSIIDMKDGWMKTESRNLEWTGVLSVLERQDYFSRNSAGLVTPANTQTDDRTDSVTTVTLYSSLGQRIKRHYARSLPTSPLSSGESATDNSSYSEEEGQPKMGFFRSWSQASIQRSIEAIGLRRTSKSQPNAREGLKIVMERYRTGGLTAVLEGIRQDREATMGGPLGILASASNSTRRDD